jgi:hypothetical protein
MAVDLFAGTGSATAAMRDRGWRVVTVEKDASHSPDIVADARFFRWSGQTPDFVWASPPCTEFSRESMPWCRTGKEPSLELVLAAVLFIERVNPPWWCIENVRGAGKWFHPLLGEPAYRFGPYFLWGRLPAMTFRMKRWERKESKSGQNAKGRAMIPYSLSDAIAEAIEAAAKLEPMEDRS